MSCLFHSQTGVVKVWNILFWWYFKHENVCSCYWLKLFLNDHFHRGLRFPAMRSIYIFSVHSTLYTRYISILDLNKQNNNRFSALGKSLNEVMLYTWCALWTYKIFCIFAGHHLNELMCFAHTKHFVVACRLAQFICRNIWNTWIWHEFSFRTPKNLWKV